MQKNKILHSKYSSILKFLSFLFAISFIFACASNPEEESKSVRDSSLTPDAAAKTLFERGENQLNNGNYEAAGRYFSQLEIQYPLSKYTRQAQINIIYIHYKRNNTELAVDAANQFIKENPVNDQLDYVYYLLGLIHFDRDNNRLENIFNVGRDKRPQNDMQDSLEYFETLITKYPESKYTEDAKQRLVFIRERLAKHELSVAEYYVRKRVFIGAVNRAKLVLEDYPDTQAARRALDILEISYNNLGMNDLAADIQRIKASN